MTYWDPARKEILGLLQERGYCGRLLDGIMAWVDLIREHNGFYTNATPEIYDREWYEKMGYSTKSNLIVPAMLDVVGPEIKNAAFEDLDGEALKAMSQAVLEGINIRTVEDNGHWSVVRGIAVVVSSAYDAEKPENGVGQHFVFNSSLRDKLKQKMAA